MEDKNKAVKTLPAIKKGQIKKMSTQDKRELQKMFRRFWRLSEKKKELDGEIKAQKGEILAKTLEFDGSWDGGTFRVGTDVVRLYKKEVLKSPPKTRLDVFAASNQEYLVSNPALNEELILTRLKEGNGYLKDFGFSIQKRTTVTFEKK